jgi:hypothetical protein
LAYKRAGAFEQNGERGQRKNKKSYRENKKEREKEN